MFDYEVATRSLSPDEFQILAQWMSTLPEESWYQLRATDQRSDVLLSQVRIAFEDQKDAVLFALYWA